MDQSQGESSYSGDNVVTSVSLRLIDDPNNYGREQPVRISRNLNPIYDVTPSMHQPMPKSKRTGSKAEPVQGSSQSRKLTSRRKDEISTFLNDCSSNPGKYGQVGNLAWFSELSNQVNAHASSCHFVSVSDVVKWIDRADFAATYETLKATGTRQPVAVPGTSSVTRGVDANQMPLYSEVASRSLETGLLPNSGNIPGSSDGVSTAGNQPEAYGVAFPELVPVAERNVSEDDISEDGAVD